MRFFKHFADAHRGQSLQSLRTKKGMAAVGRWWTLVELCAEKLEKAKEEEFTESHCNFTFSKPYLAASLGLANLKQTATYLEAIALLGLCSVEHGPDAVVISMPKLLECMDRDSKRARSERVLAAPKKKRKNKKKEEEIELKSDSVFDEAFNRLAKKYRDTFPGATTGGKARVRFSEQCTDAAAIKDLDDSIEHYRRALKTQPWRAFKTTFETFLGTESSGFFWHDYIEMPDLPELPQSNSLDDLDLTTKEGA